MKKSLEKKKDIPWIKHKASHLWKDTRTDDEREKQIRSWGEKEFGR